MTSSRKRAGSEQSRTAYSTAEQDSLGENEKDRINKLFLPLFKEPEPWAHFERSHCSWGAQGAPEEPGTVLGWGTERGITEIQHDNSLGHSEVISHLRSEYTDSAVGRVASCLKANPGAAEKSRGFPGAWNITKVGYHVPRSGPWVWMTTALDCQVSRGQENDFFLTMSPLMLQTLEQVERPVF